jgi:hypothetical protein
MTPLVFAVDRVDVHDDSSLRFVRLARNFGLPDYFEGRDVARS